VCKVDTANHSKPAEVGAEERSPGARGRDDRWLRLEALLRRVGEGGLARLDDGEVEELGRLYRAATTHLALLRSFGASTRRRDHLNALVSRGHALIYGQAPKGRGRGALRLHLLAFPGTVRRTLRYHLFAFVLLAMGGLYGFQGAAADPDWALEFIGKGDDRTPYATRDELFDALRSGQPESRRRAGTGDASSGEASSDESATGDEASSLEGDRAVGIGQKAFFAAYLWKHNTSVALGSFFAGFLAGIPTVFAILMNGILLGSYTQTFHGHGLAYEWWAWILPHGVTELLALVLLAGGGLWIGHIVVAPGERSRAQAFRTARGDMMRLLVFAFLMCLAAAVIESFLRQSGLGDPARYAFAAMSAVFWALYLGLVRPSGEDVRRALAPRTAVERVVPLPRDEELLRLLSRTGRR